MANSDHIVRFTLTNGTRWTVNINGSLNNMLTQVVHTNQCGATMTQESQHIPYKHAVEHDKI